MSRGRVRKALSGFYYVDVDGREVTCRARGKFRQEGKSPLVGDWVEVLEDERGQGTVWEIEERRNAFQRPAAANVDQLVVVSSAALPVTDPFLIDRVAAIAALKDCAVADIYRAAGFPVVCTSAETGEGIEDFKALLAGKLSALTGNSGVGKSSLLNAAEPGFSLRAAAISERLGRGKHTTRHVELFRLTNGGEVIDTPGFASFDAREMDLELKERLPEAFVEFRQYLGRCRFADCSHTREKGCAVLEAVRAGKIPQSRHKSYLRLYQELKDLRAWNVRS